MHFLDVDAIVGFSLLHLRCLSVSGELQYMALSSR